MKRPAILLALLAGGAFAREAGEWDFAVTLDDQPIGTHRFVVRGQGEARRVDSRADLAVRLLGIPVYRYRHQADERWQGDCLRELRADTDDGGQRQQVARNFDGPGCLMAFAYWNPRLVQQHQLVNPQSGQIVTVRFEPLAEASIEVRGRPVRARGWRLIAEEQRITVWYAADGGRWIALDAQAKGGRRLSYRLPPPSDEKDPP